MYLCRAYSKGMKHYPQCTLFLMFLQLRRKMPPTGERVVEPSQRRPGNNPKCQLTPSALVTFSFPSYMTISFLRDITINASLVPHLVVLAFDVGILAYPVRKETAFVGEFVG